MKSFLLRLGEEEYEKLVNYSKSNHRSLASTCRHALSRLTGKNGN